MVSPNEWEDGIASGEPPFTRKLQHGIREDEPSIFDSPISISQSLIDVDRTFRAQILALGAAWISIGLVSAIILVCTLTGDWRGQAVRSLHQAILFSCGIQTAWLPFGMLTCLRKMWAMYCGLGLSYFVALSPVFCAAISFAMADLSLLPLAGVSTLSSLVFMILILQAHRVISLANRLHKEGMR